MARASLLRDSATAASKRCESCRAYSVIGITLVLHPHGTGHQSIFIMARCEFYARHKVETNATESIGTPIRRSQFLAMLELVVITFSSALAKVS
jgi:hypothetical protein